MTLEQEKQSRVWFITGCSTGLGRALAQGVLEHDDRLVATARQLSSLEDLAQEAAAQKPLLAQLDVTDIQQVNAAIDAAFSAFGRIDVLVNNAGYGLLGALEELSEKQIRDQFEANVFGVMNVTKAVLPFMRAQKSGHIINISSVGGQVASAGLGVYQASKFAVEGLSESLAKEVAPFGIKVTIIEPGGFRTNWSGRSMARATPLDEYQGTAAEQTKQRIAAADGKQPGDPARAAEVLMQLAEMEHPPLRLPLGKDALKSIRQKLTDELKEFEHWESLITSTSFPSS